MAERDERQDPITNERTTVEAEDARRAERERQQRDHPELLAGRGRDTAPEPPPVDAGKAADVGTAGDGERFHARENENLSEG